MITPSEILANFLSHKYGRKILGGGQVAQAAIECCNGSLSEDEAKEAREWISEHVLFLSPGPKGNLLCFK